MSGSVAFADASCCSHTWLHMRQHRDEKASKAVILAQLPNVPMTSFPVCLGEHCHVSRSKAGLGYAGIKAIKLHAWEAPFEKRINHLREVEMQQIRQGPAHTLLCHIICLLVQERSLSGCVERDHFPKTLASLACSMLTSRA